MRFLFIFVMFVGTHQMFGQSVKVITYNIRYDNVGDGVNQWANRKEKVAALIRETNPDLIGLQEALLGQINDLLLLLPDYTHYGVGRDDGKEGGEFSTILVRHSRFGVVKDSTFWLSETPTVAGSKSWDAAYPRVATWVELYDIENKKEILCLNTHFDHVGSNARNNSAGIIMKFLENVYREKPINIILTGDLNVERNTEAFHILTSSKFLIDSKPRKNTDPTFCGFDVRNKKCTGIDYILHSKELVLKKYRVLKNNDGKHYYSDHLPVVVEYKFAEVKTAP